MNKFQDSLKALKACRRAVDWVGDRTASQAWDECERGDWMLWYAIKLKADRKLIMRAAATTVVTYAAFYTAGADAATRKAERKIMADLVRSVIPFPGEPR
jgi:hypothetical protein